MAMYSVLISLIFFFGGGSGKGIDLLDVLSSDAYWQSKNVTVSLEQLQADAGPDKPVVNVEGLIKGLQADEFAAREKARQELERMGPAVIPQLRPATSSTDPEVAAVANALIKQFTERAQERSIRRLMAIRTLGERKEQAALPLLKTLVESKELFVSDYALRAVAQVEGRVVEAVSHKREFERDAGLLPTETGIIGQLIGEGTETLSLPALVEDAVEAMKASGMPPMIAGQQRMPDKAKLMSVATRRLLTLVECTGNIRLDGATVGVSKDIGMGNDGSVIILARGKYNPVALRDALKLMEPAAATQPAGELAMLEMDEEATALFPADDLFVLVMSDKRAGRAGAINGVVAAIRAGQGTIKENAQLLALMNATPKTGPAWLAATVNDAMKKEKMFEGIDTFTLETTRSHEGLGFMFHGQGSDAEKVKATVDAWNTNIKQVQAMIQPEVQRNKTMAPVADFFSSMKVTADGKEATFTGEMKTTIRQAILAQMGMGIVMMLEEETQEGVGRDGLPVGR